MQFYNNSYLNVLVLNILPSHTSGSHLSRVWEKSEDVFQAELQMRAAAASSIAAPLCASSVLLRYVPVTSWSGTHQDKLTQFGRLKTCVLTRFFADQLGKRSERPPHNVSGLMSTPGVNVWRAERDRGRHDLIELNKCCPLHLVCPGSTSSPSKRREKIKNFMQTATTALDLLLGFGVFGCRNR